MNLYPNPTKGDANINISTVSDQNLTVSLYSLSGKHIANLFEGSSMAGQSQEVSFSTSSLANGVYFIKLTTVDGNSLTKRLTVAK